MTGQAGAAALVAAERRHAPAALELARYLALAVRIEPGLLRAARRALFPHAGPELEADLWLGPLVRSRNPLELVLRPDVVALLRDELRAEPAALERAWGLVRAAHARAPQAIRFEEEITYLGLRGDEAARESFEALLRRFVASLVGATDRDGLVEWTRRALPHLPESVRESEAARMLAAGAEAHGASAPVEGVAVSATESARWRGWLAAPSASTREVGVRWAKAGLLFREPEEGDAVVRVPDEARAALTLTLPLTSTAPGRHADAPARRVIDLVLPGQLPHLETLEPGPVHIVSALAEAWVRPGKRGQPRLAISASEESAIWGWDLSASLEELGWTEIPGFRRDGATTLSGAGHEALLYVLDEPLELGEGGIGHDLRAAERDRLAVFFFVDPAALERLPEEFETRLFANHPTALVSPTEQGSALDHPASARLPAFDSVGQAMGWLQARLVEVDEARAREAGLRHVVLAGDAEGELFRDAVSALRAAPPEGVRLEVPSLELDEQAGETRLLGEARAIEAAALVHVLAERPSFAAAFAYGFAQARGKPVRLLVPRDEARDRPWNRPLFGAAVTAVDPDPQFLASLLQSAGPLSWRAFEEGSDVLVLGAGARTPAAAALAELAARRGWRVPEKALAEQEDVHAALEGVGRVLWLYPSTLPVDDDAYLDAAVAGRAYGLGIAVSLLVDAAEVVAGEHELFTAWSSSFRGVEDLARVVDEVTGARPPRRVLVLHDERARGAHELVERVRPELEAREQLVLFAGDAERGPAATETVGEADLVVLLQHEPSDWLRYHFGLAAGLGKPAVFAVAAVDPVASAGPVAPERGLPHRVLTEGYDLAALLAEAPWTDAYDEPPAAGARTLVLLHDESDQGLRQVLSESGPGWSPEPPDWDPRDLRETFDGVGSVVWVIPQSTSARDEPSALRAILAVGYANGLGLPVTIYAQDGSQAYDWVPGYEARTPYADAEELRGLLDASSDALARYLELLRERGPVRHHGEPYDPSRYEDLGVTSRPVARDEEERVPPVESLFARLANSRAPVTLLLGWAGAGKSWALQHLEKVLLVPDELVLSRFHNDVPLPVRLDLTPFLAGTPPDPFALAARELGDDAPPGLAAALGEHAAKGGVWLLLDGLDHVAGKDRPFLADWVEALVAAHPDQRLVLALREDEPEFLPSAQRLWLARPSVPPGLEARQARVRDALASLEEPEQAS